MKSNPRIIHGKYLTALSFFALTVTAFADDLILLDDGDFFNPYTFARDPIWILLPVFALIILALHLLPVPKRKSSNPVDQARRFFRIDDDDLTPRPTQTEDE